MVWCVVRVLKKNEEHIAAAKAAWMLGGNAGYRMRVSCSTMGLRRKNVTSAAEAGPLSQADCR